MMILRERRLDSCEVTDHTIESGAPVGDALGGSAGGDDATDGELVVVRGEVLRPDDATVARGGGRGWDPDGGAAAASAGGMAAFAVGSFGSERLPKDAPHRRERGTSLTPRVVLPPRQRERNRRHARA